MVKYDDVIHTCTILTPAFLRVRHAEVCERIFYSFLKLNISFFQSNLILEKLRCIFYVPSGGINVLLLRTK